MSKLLTDDMVASLTAGEITPGLNLWWRSGEDLALPSMHVQQAGATVASCSGRFNSCIL